MIDTKFRGFSKNFTENDWFYGDLINYSENEKMIYIQNSKTWDLLEGGIIVDEKSVGRYIGVKNNEGVELYEGDIVEAKSQGTKAIFVIQFRQEASPCWILFPSWQNGQFWNIHATKHEKGKNFINVNGEIETTDKEGFFDNLKVIGNKFQNPELLEANSSKK